MNTKKVAELLAEIDRAQDAAKELAKEAAGIAKKIAAQDERVATLKRALAGFADASPSVTLSVLARKGKLARVSRGVYQLAPAAQ